MTKFLLAFSLFVLGSFSLQAQKTTKISANLYLTKGTTTRIIYDSLALSKTQAEGIVAEADKAAINNIPKMKHWLPTSYSALGIKAEKIKSTEVFYVRQSYGCDQCAKSCKAKCLKESAETCLCVEGVPTQMNSLQAVGPMVIILLSDASLQSQVLN